MKMFQKYEVLFLGILEQNMIEVKLQVILGELYDLMGQML
jgi:hypothetical protein